MCFPKCTAVFVYVLASFIFLMVGFEKIKILLFNHYINPITLRLAKTPLGFGQSECKRVKT